MATDALHCPKCNTVLPDAVFNQDSTAPCPGCNSPLLVQVFPALFRKPQEGKAGETILVEGEASCFYHPQKRAVIPCAACGRFLCALCDVELNDEHLCPVCLETGSRKGKLTQLETKRVLYDGSALMLALAPMVLFCFWWASLATAPAAVILGIRSLRQPQSILPRTRFRSYAAITLGLAQAGCWVLFFAGAFRHVRWLR